MSSNATMLDPAAGMCPACGGELAPGATECGACRTAGRARGAPLAAAEAAIGFAWFCSAVVILWFFGSLALAPWQPASRVGPMPLPWGGHFDLTLGRGATSRCAVRVTRGPASTEVVVMQGACSAMGVHRWLADNEQRPALQGVTLGTPYTVAAPPGAEATAARTRLLVSCLFTVAAGLAGAFVALGSVAVATGLLTRLK